ncbi:MAG: acetylxylan esterase, partial [Prevotella sp.]|nr:acetylxylan esterase [Prevotella sp.]
MKHTRLLFLLLVLTGMLPISAQIRGNNIQVTVVPDHQDWRYEVGQTATFKVSVTKSNTLLDNVMVDYEAGPEMYQDVKKKGVVLKDGTLTLKGKMTTPGF